MNEFTALLHVLLIPLLFVFQVVKWILIVLIGYWLVAGLLSVIFIAVGWYFVYKLFSSK